MTTEQLSVVRCAFLDLEGILPEFEPSGERLHPAWTTLAELKGVIEKEDPEWLKEQPTSYIFETT